MENKVKKIFTVDFFYLLFLIAMIPIMIGSKSILDLSYFVIITYNYIKLKLYEKKII